MSVLIATNLRKELSGSALFDGVSFSVGRKDRLALSGPNGAGKTTLLEGLLRPTRVGNGVVSLTGRRVPDELPVEAYLREVGHMPQDWTYFPGFSVEESVAYTAWLKKVPAKQVAAKKAVARKLPAKKAPARRPAAKAAPARKKG